ncbi:hypothetical protein ZWY2020_015752 [Hordeum vulgare]|nr:hypothetical protein ZWY2020_015752 [Hordeum vulgare]
MARHRLPRLLILPVTLTILILLFLSSSTPPPPPQPPIPCGAAPSDATAGRWVPTPSPPPPPLYIQSCPFHRNAWNCLRNGRPPVAALSWAPFRCGGAVVPRLDPAAFLAAARGRRIGLVGDSLSENLVVALLCALRSGDGGARKWKRRGAWRGGYFPARTSSSRTTTPCCSPSTQNSKPQSDGIKGTYRVDVDIPADDWANITKFYDVLIFNTGHWFGGVNKEARLVNSAIWEALVGTDIQLLNLTYMASSVRRPSSHLAPGRRALVAVWGQDCMHWCLPGVPDTWVDILAVRILHYFKQGKG